MASLGTAFSTAVTPAAGKFSIQVKGGRGAMLQWRNSSASAVWAKHSLLRAGVTTVTQDVAGVQFQVVAAPGDADGVTGLTLQIDQ